MATVKFEFEISDIVIIYPHKTVGAVEAAMKDGDGIKYRVVHWVDGVRHSDWMNAWEIFLLEEEKEARSCEES